MLHTKFMFLTQILCVVSFGATYSVALSSCYEINVKIDIIADLTSDVSCHVVTLGLIIKDVLPTAVRTASGDLQLFKLKFQGKSKKVGTINSIFFNEKQNTIG